jgi:hypothetical protein
VLVREPGNREAQQRLHEVREQLRR